VFQEGKTEEEDPCKQVSQKANTLEKKESEEE
jgi:hypothetical protein